MTTVLQEEQLAAFITNTLDNCLPHLNNADDVLRAHDLVFAITRRATNAFLTQWNARSGIPLPLELYSEILGHLDFNGCLAFSAVCKRWRAIALDEPRIWSSFTIDRRKESILKLEVMLKRSRAVPLSVVVLTTNDYQVQPLLHQHMWRMKALRTDFCPNQTVLKQRAPVLESLRITTYPHDFIALPEDLVGAQCLRTLAVPKFNLPERCPTLQNLVSFTGTFDRTHQLRDLFNLCPRLVNLAVKCGRHSELALNPLSILTPVPASIRTLRLLDFSLGSLDYQGPLQSYAGRTFDLISFSHCATLLGPLELFARSHDRPWSMDLATSATVKLCTTDALDELSMHVFVTDPGPVTPTFADSLDPSLVTRLVSLNLAERDFHILRISSPTLPRLKSLTISLTAILAENRPLRGRFIVPALEQVTVVALPIRQTGEITAGVARSEAWLTATMLEWFFVLLPKRLRPWLKYDAASLARIELSGTLPADLVLCIVHAGISEYADELVLPVVASSAR